MKFDLDIPASLKMSCYNFGDPVIFFHLTLSLYQYYFMSSTLVYDQIPAKLMTFLLALLSLVLISQCSPAAC